MRMPIDQTGANHTSGCIQHLLRLIFQAFTNFDDLAAIHCDITIFYHPAFRIHGDYHTVFNQ